MSFSGIKEFIEYGDTVLIHVGYNNLLPIIVEQGKTSQTKFGAVRHRDMVGKKFGTRIECAKGWICAIHPTPELWTDSLPHRTQILYTTDISMVIFQLDLKPGSVVVEAGTGSGSLSHSILRTIQPTGHLHTFEFHQERARKAEEEFQLHGLAPFVTVTHRDVIEEGFTCDHIADAVFLDLPRPWDCIHSAKLALKKEGGRICSFSPCIEQVQRSCEKLKEEGFYDIVTLECLNRKFNINYAKLQNVSFSKENEDPPTKELSCDNHALETVPAEESSTPAKLPKLNGTDQQFSEKSDTKDESKQSTDKSGTNNESIDGKKPGRDNSNALCFTSAVPATIMPGHTGFLTFATLPFQD